MRRHVILTLTLMLTDCPLLRADDSFDHVVDNDRVSLAIRALGALHDQQVLLAVPGGPGASGDYLRVLESQVPAGFRVVTFDPRGVGRSSMEAGEALDLEAAVRDIEAIRTWSHAERIHILGHSWGGIVAMAYANEHPERLASVSLISSGVPSDADWGMMNASIRERLRSTPHVPVPPGISEDCAGWWHYYVAYYADIRKIRPEHLPTVCSVDVHARTLEENEGFDVSAGLRRTDAPYLLVFGDPDPLTVAREPIRQGLPLERTTDVTLEGCGHRPMLECPDRFSQVLGSFLRASLETQDATAPETMAAAEDDAPADAAP